MVSRRWDTIPPFKSVNMYTAKGATDHPRSKLVPPFRSRRHTPYTTITTKLALRRPPPRIANKNTKTVSFLEMLPTRGNPPQFTLASSHIQPAGDGSMATPSRHKRNSRNGASGFMLSMQVKKKEENHAPNCHTRSRFPLDYSGPPTIPPFLESAYKKITLHLPLFDQKSTARYVLK